MPQEDGCFLDISGHFPFYIIHWPQYPVYTIVRAFEGNIIINGFYKFDNKTYAPPRQPRIGSWAMPHKLSTEIVAQSNLQPLCIRKIRKKKLFAT
jgi:hypothetical protein